MSHLLSASFLSIALALSAFGCSGDDDEPSGSGGRSGGGGASSSAGNSNGGNGSGGACPNLAGKWTVTKHCQTNFVNTMVDVTQTGCTASVPSFSFSGTVGPNGELNLSSSMGSCTGGLNGNNTIDEQCTVLNIPCTVQLTR